MRLLIFNFIPLLSLTWASPLPTNTTDEYLVEFFEYETNLLAEDFCRKAQELSQQLILNKDLQEDYKFILKDFLLQYPHFERYKIFQPLGKILLNIVNSEYPINLESDRKFKQILKKDFSNLTKEYEQNYVRFFKDKFVPKLNDYKEKLKPQELEKIAKFQEILEILETCQNYTCLPTNLDRIIEADKSLVTKYINFDLKTLILLTCIRLYDAGGAILKDPVFSELSSETLDIFIKDIKDFNGKFENSNDIETLWKLIQENVYFSKEYYNKDKLPSKDREIWDNILSKHNSVQNKSEFVFESKNLASYLTIKLFFVALSFPETYKGSLDFVAK